MKRAKPRPPGDATTVEHVGPITAPGSYWSGKEKGDAVLLTLHATWHVCAACNRSWRGKRNVPRCAPRLVQDGWPG